MNFSSLISRDNWNFHYQKTLCVIHIYTTPIKLIEPRKTMPGNNALSWPHSLSRITQMSRPPSKAPWSNLPLRREILPSNPCPLPVPPSPPPHGVYIDRCIKFKLWTPRLINPILVYEFMKRSICRIPRPIVFPRRHSLKNEFGQDSLILIFSIIRTHEHT